MSEKKLTPFDYLNAINGKTNTDLDLAQYSPFMVNRGLSYFKDTVHWANEMNMRSNLDNDQQYAFLLGAVAKGRRMSKWAKSETSDDIDAIMEFYGVNRIRALEMLPLLNTDMMTEIMSKMYKGGRT